MLKIIKHEKSTQLFYPFILFYEILCHCAQVADLADLGGYFLDVIQSTLH